VTAVTCYVCARLCQCFGQGGCYFRSDEPCVPATTPANNSFCYFAVAHILTPSVNLAFRPKSGFKNKCRARAGFELVTSGSDWVQASKWGPLTTLCGYVCRGQQGEIERIHPPPGAQPGGIFGAFAPPKFSKHCTAILTFAETFK